MMTSLSAQMGPKPAVSLLDVLLRIRGDMRGRTAGPYEYIGMPEVEWVTTPTLDFLSEILRETAQEPSRLMLFIGHPDVRRMAGLIDGHRLCLALAGARDEEYARFERWLHEARGLPAGQTWPHVYLQACRGDSAQAIHRLLLDAAALRGGS